MMPTHTRVALIGLGLVGLTACSGGGGNTSTAPAAPSVTSAVGVKQLLFEWPGVPGAELYRVKENPDGASGFTQIGADLPAAQTAFHVDVAVHRHDWQNARYLVEACNGVGCADSAGISFTGSANDAIGYFKAANNGAGDRFGTTVAVSADGNTLAVGAPREGSGATGINGDATLNNASGAGAVYIFTRDAGGAWFQQAYIKASNTGAGDLFGAALALSRDGATLAVGAYLEDGPDSGINGANDFQDTGTDSGAVYVFTRGGGGVWSQQAYVKASNNIVGLNDHFGYAVALNGDGGTLAVGAPLEDSAAVGINGDQNDTTFTNAGAVYVFTRDGAGTWSQQAYVKASNTGRSDQFGNAVALDGGGDTLAVGANQEDSAATGVDGDQNDGGATGAGAAYVFTRDSAGTWRQQAYIKAFNTSTLDQFGYAITLSGDGATLAVGAPYEDSVITDSGAAYTYTRDGAGAWSEQAMAKAANGDGGDHFGSTVALDENGRTLVAGAPGEDSAATGIGGDQADDSANGAGAAYVFSRDASGLWSQTTYLKPPTVDPNDDFGVSSAVDADGGTIGVGADLEDGAAAGIDGDQADNNANAAGAAYLY